MLYEKSKKYDVPRYLGRIMGPNPIKLEEELLTGCRIPAGATVLDLGCGQGVTSVFLAKEYGFRVFATDLWSKPGDNMRFFEEEGLTSQQIIPIHADANDLPYAEEFFDAVVTTDSYHYFGRDPEFLGSKLLPCLKHGGYCYIAIPGFKRDCHDALPPELLLSWTPEDLETMHDTAYWTRMIGHTEGIAELSVREMESLDEVWADWLKCDNPYARGDRKTLEAGGIRYLNFISIVFRRA